MKILTHIPHAVLSLSLLLYPALASAKDSQKKNYETTAVKEIEIEEIDLFNDIAFADEDDDPLFNEFFDTAATSHMTRSIDPEEIMTLLNKIDAPAILQNPFFFQTNPLNNRNPLDEPIFEPDLTSPPGDFVIGVNTFIRKTDRSNFTKHSTKLSSYLSLVESDFIDSLENSIQLLANLLKDPAFNIDIRHIFMLFENMTVEERQAGFMVHLMKKWNKITLRVMAPVYYIERNFSLTIPERDAIAEEFGAQDPEQEDAFAKKHFISDRIGVGDTRLEIDSKVIHKPAIKARFGFQATIPTAFTWGQGFLGSPFADPSTFPNFDFASLFNLAENPSEENAERAFAILSDFLLDSFDRIAADLLHVPLGNKRHLGLGIFMRGKTSFRSVINKPWADHIALTNRISLEFFLPSTESRFYANCIDPQLFSERDFNDLNQAAQNLSFLQEQLVERLFLRAFNTRIRPGVIFRWTSTMRYQAQRFGIYGGSDLWLQNKEKRGSLCTRQSTINQLNLAIAKPPVAWQTKFYGGVTFRHNTPRRVWFFSLNGDVTWDNRGIGSDYAIAFNFETSF